MKISVVIPAYNAAATIDETIRSVLAQTQPAEEILVLDDGSTDDTFARLSAYGSRIKVFRQTNQGLSAARNFLCRKTVGEVVAFLDADDVWHPDYLKVQGEMLSTHPDAVASVTSCLDSDQFAKKPWGSLDSGSVPAAECVDAVRFFKRYNYSLTQFPPSTWCVLKKVLDQMGDKPFLVRFAEDFWFMNMLLLFGKPVMQHSSPLVMYRLSPGSLSTDRLKMTESVVCAGEILLCRYQTDASPELLKSLREVFSSTRRKLARHLMGVDRLSAARAQVWKAIRESRSPASIGKSFFLLALCHLPAGLQPSWPRQFRKCHYQMQAADANISVLIPTYNSAATIEATLISVLRQTRAADEIIVLVDGGTDDTVARLEQFRGRITVIEQSNAGISAARNKLVKLARGNLLAFLDSDDLWHPDYLKTQQESFLKHPEAVAFFTGHNNFYGEENYSWPDGAVKISLERELIPGKDFFRRYNEAAGPFASMSYCCLPKAALEKLDGEPFALDCGITEDSYLLYWLSLFGPLVYAPEPLAAYRIRRGSISDNRLRAFKSWVRVFENLEGKFAAANQPEMFELFQRAFASKRREMAKRLLGAGQVSEAREQLRRSFSNCPRPASIVKSFGLLGLSYLPRSLQFAWPSDLRMGSEKREQSPASVKVAK